MKLRFPSAFLWGLFVAITLGSSEGRLAAQITGDFPQACSPKNLENTAMVAGFDFRSFRNKDDGTACLQVLRRGKVVYQDNFDNAGFYILGQQSDPKEQWIVPPMANGTDVTGRGGPDMIVVSYSGGALCCFSTSIFELRPTFHLLATVNDGFFSDLDHRGHYYYYQTNDDTFFGWPGSDDESPTVDVILRFREGAAPGFHLALRKMQKPAPTAEQWAKNLAKARATFTEDQWEQFAGPTLWQPILDLIYSGHSDLAWKFLDEAWPPKVPEKDQWVDGLCTMLRRSPYWADLQGTIRNAPPSCIPNEQEKNGR
ncbi:MAG TPA: hypothetical protein VMI06_06540 [Terriglobia bacterium]|nr:hypothetical protein [Terriglobia bacterium]